MVRIAETDKAPVSSITSFTPSGRDSPGTGRRQGCEWMGPQEEREVAAEEGSCTGTAGSGAAQGRKVFMD